MRSSYMAQARAKLPAIIILPIGRPREFHPCLAFGGCGPCAQGLISVIEHGGSVCCDRSPMPVLQNQGGCKKYLRCDRLTLERSGLRGSAGQYCRVAISMHMRLQQGYRRQLEITRFARRKNTGLVEPAPAFVGVHI